MDTRHLRGGIWRLGEKDELCAATAMHSSPAEKDAAPITEVAHGISERAIREELTRILENTILLNSDRISRFLYFTEEMTLAGNADTLKEYVIGVEVYGRKPPYHPTQNSIVRIEARRLRRKLKEYYDQDGKNNSVFIYLRPGTYVPVFRSGEIAVGLTETQFSFQGKSSTDLAIGMVILPFVDISLNALSTVYARGLNGERPHASMKADGFGASAQKLNSEATSPHWTAPLLTHNLGVQIAMEGTVSTEGNQLRVTAPLTNADGFQIWSQCFEAQADYLDTPAGEALLDERMTAAPQEVLAKLKHVQDCEAGIGCPRKRFRPGMR